MGLIRRRTPNVYQQRRYEYTGTGYRASDVHIHPDDLYVRVPGTQPYDRAWQGVQKDNAISSLASASVWVGLQPLGGLGSVNDAVYPVNPMRFMGVANRTTQKAPGRTGAVGPGMTWMPNPTEPLGGNYNTPQDRPGLFSAIRRALGW